MFIRSLIRSATRIPLASASRFSAFNKCPNFQVFGSLASPCLQRTFASEVHASGTLVREPTEKPAKPNNRETICSKQISHGEFTELIELKHSADEGYSIFLNCIKYAFLTPDQAKALLEKIDEYVDVPNDSKIHEIYQDGSSRLTLRKNKAGVLYITSIKKNKTNNWAKKSSTMTGIVPEAVAGIKENLKLVLEEYEKLAKK